jgi:glutamate-1-semialdehyde 2,1-aminomutase
VDEVITFRLHEGGLHQEYGAEPDLISLGKIIGGGFPVGAIGGDPSVLSSFSPLFSDAVAWGGTFSANPVTMAAGLTALRRFGSAEIAELNRAGDELRARLRAEGAVVNGSGSLLRLMSPDPVSQSWKMYRRGALAGTNGLLALSTAMSPAQLDTVADVILEVAGQAG